MGAIETKLNQFLNAEPEDLKDIMHLLGSKGFFENDNSLDMFFTILEIAHSQGFIEGMNHHKELLEMLRKKETTSDEK